MMYTGDAETIAMASDAIRFYAAGLIFYSFNLVIQNFCQGTGKIVTTMIICTCLELVFMVVPIFVLPEFMGANGIWATFVLCQFLTFLVYLVMAMIHNKKIFLNLDELLMLDVDDEHKIEKFEYSACDEEDVMMASVGADALCHKNNIDAKRANAISLCIEEMAMNIVERGIKNPKKQRIDIKVVIMGEDVIIRLRDNCVAFNPIDHHKQFDEDDPMAGIGIRMVFKLAKDVNYISTMKLNNLTIKL